jgi:multidrug efflux pump subunit AcrA (membrane-fusion protein)
LVILPFIYVDVSVQARGYFQSELEKQILFTPFQGKITYSSIRNGDHVNKGDTLLIIDKKANPSFQYWLRIDTGLNLMTIGINF